MWLNTMNPSWVWGMDYWLFTRQWMAATSIWTVKSTNTLGIMTRVNRNQMELSLRIWVLWSAVKCRAPSSVDFRSYGEIHLFSLYAECPVSNLVKKIFKVQMYFTQWPQWETSFHRVFGDSSKFHPVAVPCPRRHALECDVQSWVTNGLNWEIPRRMVKYTSGYAYECVSRVD